MSFVVHDFDPDLAARRRQRQYEKWCKRANIPVRFFESLDDLDLESKVRASCNTLVERLDINSRPFGKGIIFWGPPGTGKSTTSLALLRRVLEVVDPNYLNCVDGYGPNVPGYYLTYPDLIRTEKESWGDDEEAEEAKVLLRRIYCRGPRHDRVKVLVLDDVGKEHAGASGFASNVMHDVIRSRYDDAAPTIITTNLRPSEWREYYGEATHSFIHEAFTLVKVGGEDRRQ